MSTINKVLDVVDEFIDYEGLTHKFVIVAAKHNIKEDGDYPMVMYPVSEDSVEGDIYLKTGVSIGVSICNPVDIFNERVGLKVALARAENSDCVLFSQYPGQLGDSVIEAYLHQEAEYIKNNPGKFIKGYKEKELRYDKRMEMESIKSTFSDFENAVYEELKKDPNCLDYVNEYFEYSNTCENTSIS